MKKPKHTLKYKKPDHSPLDYLGALHDPYVQVNRGHGKARALAEEAARERHKSRPTPMDALRELDK